MPISAPASWTSWPISGNKSVRLPVTDTATAAVHKFASATRAQHAEVDVRRRRIMCAPSQIIRHGVILDGHRSNQAAEHTGGTARVLSDLSLAQRVAAERHISRTIVASVRRQRHWRSFGLPWPACQARRTDHAPLRNRFDVTVLDPDLQGRLCRTRFPALSYAVVPGRVPVFFSDRTSGGFPPRAGDAVTPGLRTGLRPQALHQSLTSHY
jgi:hypothetical protein